MLENYQAMNTIEEFFNYFIKIKIEGTGLIKTAKVIKDADGFQKETVRVGTELVDF